MARNTTRLQYEQSRFNFCLKISYLSLYIFYIITLFAVIYPPQLIFYLKFENNFFSNLDIFILLIIMILFLYDILFSMKINVYFLLFISIANYIFCINMIINQKICFDVIISHCLWIFPIYIVFKKFPFYVLKRFLLFLYILLSFNYILGFLLKFTSLKYIFLKSYLSTHKITRFVSIIGAPTTLGPLCSIMIGLSFFLFYKRRILFFGLASIFLLLSLLIGSRLGIVITFLTYLYGFTKINVKFKLQIFLFFLFLFLFYIYSTNTYNKFYFHDLSSALRFNAWFYFFENFKSFLISGKLPGTFFLRGNRELLGQHYKGFCAPLMKKEGLIMPIEPHSTFILLVIEYSFAFALVYYFVMYYIFSKTQVGDLLKVFRFAIFLNLFLNSFFYSFVYNIRYYIILLVCLNILLNARTKRVE